MQGDFCLHYENLNMFVPAVEKEGRKFVELKPDYKRRNISWLLASNTRSLQRLKAPHKTIIDEIIRAGQDKLMETLKARGLAIPPRHRGYAWKKLHANVVSLKGTVFNIVVKGKAIEILLPGFKDKSLFVEASEDVFEFIVERN